MLINRLNSLVFLVLSTCVIAGHIPTANQISFSETPRFDINQGNILFQALQQGKSEQPPESVTGPLGDKMMLELSGPLPTDQDVRKAIVTGVDYLMSKQKKNGSWDVVLKGTLLSKTADQAVDAVALTSLCALGLRAHTKTMPDRKIDEACQKAAHFVMNRIIRGTLSNVVNYAIWRYSMGLQFLTSEYKYSLADKKVNAEEGAKYRAELTMVANRMIRNIVKMQLSGSGDKNVFKGKSAPRISSKLSSNMLRPARLGITCVMPTDQDYRGGAVIESLVKGGVADTLGMKVGDRIHHLDGQALENAYDFYIVEADFVTNQKIRLEFHREVDGSAKNMWKVVVMTSNWPNHFGMKISPSASGLIIDKFEPGSPAIKAGLKKGDFIFQVNKTKVKSIKEYLDVVKTLKAGKKYALRYKRKGKSKTAKVALTTVPPGYMDFYVEPENKSGKNGVVVSSVGKISRKQGLESYDRITHVNGVMVLGIDHIISILATIPSSHEAEFTVVRKYREKIIDPKMIEAMKKKYGKNVKLVDPNEGKDKTTKHLKIKIKPTSYVRGSKSGIIWGKDTYHPQVVKLEKRSAFGKAGIKKGDVIKSIRFKGIGKSVNFWTHYSQISKGDSFHFEDIGHKSNVDYGMRFVPAGADVIIVVSRYGKDKEIEVKNTDKFTGTIFEKGGWNYYKMGHAASFITATVVVAILDAKKIMGGDLKLPGAVRTRIVDGALNLLEGMQKSSEDNAGYMYYNYTSATPRDVRGMIGRIGACELALYKGRRHKKKEAKRSIQTWLKHRHELDKVRKYKITHYRPLYNNAAYYWLFGHYHIMVLANIHGGLEQKKTNEIVLKAMMLTRNKKDGTWMGHESFGEICGTARAMMIFGELKGKFHDAKLGDAGTKTYK